MPATCIEFPLSCLTIEAAMVDGVCKWLETWWNRTILKPDSLTLSNHHYAIITRTVSQIKVLIPIFGFCDFHEEKLVATCRISFRHCMIPSFVNFGGSMRTLLPF